MNDDYLRRTAQARCRRVFFLVSPEPKPAGVYTAGPLPDGRFFQAHFTWDGPRWASAYVHLFRPDGVSEGVVRDVLSNGEIRVVRRDSDGSAIR